MTSPDLHLMMLFQFLLSTRADIPTHLPLTALLCCSSAWLLWGEGCEDALCLADRRTLLHTLWCSAENGAFGLKYGEVCLLPIGV